VDLETTEDEEGMKLMLDKARLKELEGKRREIILGRFMD